MSPTVSVLLPVYNAERYLAQAVDSILAQTFTDFEFLIVDDGSTDGSLAILQNYAQRDPRIRLVSRPNTGYVVALNEMLGLARGEFLARMDADDIALPDRFARQVDFLREHPDHVVVGSAIQLIDPDGCPLAIGPIIETHEEIEAAHLQGRVVLCHPSTMLRREAVLAVGGYRELPPAEDVDLYFRLAERNGRITNLPEPLLKYRRHPTAIGVAQSTNQLNTIRRIVEEAYQRRGLGPLPEHFHADLANPHNSLADQYCTWAWWALRNKHVATARKHAFRTLRQDPWNIESWRVLACALRGH